MFGKQTQEENKPLTLDEIFDEAISERASDVHIEPLESQASIRFRVDGKLRQKWMRPLYELDPLLNRIKVLANLDITSHTIPQDGHFELIKTIKGPQIKKTADGSGITTEQTETRLDMDKTLNVRVSVFPTVDGEATVLRLLDRKEMLIAIKDLGMGEDELLTIQNMISRRYGMILVTGPSGSGKTTTLYSILRELKSSDKNIITLEDPVEYDFADIRQCQINTGQNFDFASGLKSILRQDPDIIMIGEIRDSETAENAIRASLTGKIVFSTIHANNNIGTIARLIDMKIEKGLIAYAMNGVISQRLIRKNCPHCVETYTPAPEYLSYFKIEADNGAEFKKGRGCKICGNTGYYGRTGIFEMIEFDDQIRSMIIERASMKNIQEYVGQLGIKNLKQQALEKAQSGITSLEEAASAV